MGVEEGGRFYFLSEGRPPARPGLKAMAADAGYKDTMGSVQIVTFDIGTRNFAFAVGVADLETGALTPGKVEVVDFGAKKRNMQRIVETAIDTLDRIMFQCLDMSLPTVVGIEIQMTAAMRAIQTTVHVFFRTLARYTKMDIQTRYISPKHKLQLMGAYVDFKPFQEAVAKQATTKYKRNKLNSIAFATWLLQEKEQCPEFLAQINAYRKKDDACDCYLMMAYIARNLKQHYIPPGPDSEPVLPRLYGFPTAPKKAQAQAAPEVADGGAGAGEGEGTGEGAGEETGPGAV